MEDTTRRQIDWVVIIAIVASLIVWGIGSSQRRDRLVEKLAYGTPEQQLEATRQLVAGRMLADALKGEPRWVQDAAVRSIEQMGTPQAWYQLLAAFTQLDQPARDRATALLISAGESAIPTLVEALKDKDAATRAGVNPVLIGVGEPTIPYLLPLMDAWDEYVRIGVNTVLGGIGEPALDDLIAVLKRNAPRPEQDAEAYLRERGTAQAAIRRMKATAFPAIVDELLSDSNSDVRGIGTSLLGQIADQTIAGALAPEDAAGAVAPLLNAVANDSSYAVRRRAVASIGLLGQVAVENGAVAPLVARLGDTSEHTDVRAAVAESLGRLGDPAAAQPLVSALVANRSGISGQLVDALVRIGPKAVPALAPVLTQATGDTQLLVTRALAGISGPDPVPYLAQALTSPSSDVRQTAGEALRTRTAPVLTQHAATIVGPLTRALYDENWRVYYAARDALGKCGAVAVPSLISALNSQEVRVADMAKTALVTIGHPAIEGLLAAVRGADSEPTVARWAAIALGEMGSKAMDEVGAIATNAGLSPAIRSVAALALGLTGHTAALNHLAKAYTATQPEVGAAVVKAAARIPSADGIPLALKGLQSGNPIIQDAAMDTLSLWSVGDPRPDLAKLISVDDQNVAVRAAIAIVMQGDTQARSSSAEIGAVREAEVDEDIRERVGRQLTDAAGNTGLAAPLRRSATIAIGRLGYENAISTLKGLLEAETEFASDAAQAVARIGILAAEKIETHGRQELGEAGELLLQLLTQPDASDAVHLEAAVALALMNGAGTVEMIDLISEASTPQPVKLWLAATLGALGRHAAPDVIEKHRISTDTELRNWMAMAMACMLEDARAQQTFSLLSDQERPPADTLAEVRDLADRIRMLRK